MSRRTDGKARQANFLDVCRTCPDGCCVKARPPLTRRRRQIIQDFLQNNGIAVDDPFENGKYTFPRETDEGYCVFLDKALRKCRIHPAKPETCVAGPITFDIDTETGKLEWYLKMSKICPLAGSLYEDVEAYRRHVKSAKREIRRLALELDVKALRAILTIDEPDTVRIGEENATPKLLAKLRA